MPAAQAVEQKRTRARVIREKVKIRLAPDECAGEIGRLVGMEGFAWDRVFPNWYIATVDDEVIGCVQVLPARPMGYANFLSVKRAVPFKLRAIAADKLCLAAMASLNLYGSQWLTCNTAEARFLDVLKGRGFIQVNETALMMKRLG
jgi:hypothetical protein